MRFQIRIEDVQERNLVPEVAAAIVRDDLVSWLVAFGDNPKGERLRECVESVIMAMVDEEVDLLECDFGNLDPSVSLVALKAAVEEFEGQYLQIKEDSFGLITAEYYSIDTDVIRSIVVPRGAGVWTAVVSPRAGDEERFEADEINRIVGSGFGLCEPSNKAMIFN